MSITAVEVDDEKLWIGQKVKDWNGRILTIVPTEQVMKGYDSNTQVSYYQFQLVTKSTNPMRKYKWVKEIDLFEHMEMWLGPAEGNGRIETSTAQLYAMMVDLMDELKIPVEESKASVVVG